MASEEALSFADAVAEVRRNDVELRHTRMQPLKCLCVARCRRIGTGLFVVPPQCEGEPVSLVDTWLHTRVETRNGASDLGEPPCDLDLKLERLSARGRHPSKDIAREQPQAELVRLADDPRLSDDKPKFRAKRCRRGDRTFHFGHKHRAILVYTPNLRGARRVAFPRASNRHSPSSGQASFAHAGAAQRVARFKPKP